jgi:hypothetical protein
MPGKKKNKKKNKKAQPKEEVVPPTEADEWVLVDGKDTKEAKDSQLKVEVSDGRQTPTQAPGVATNLGSPFVIAGSSNAPEPSGTSVSTTSGSMQWPAPAPRDKEAEDAKGGETPAKVPKIAKKEANSPKKTKPAAPKVAAQLPAAAATTTSKAVATTPSKPISSDPPSVPEPSQHSSNLLLEKRLNNDDAEQLRQLRLAQVLGGNIKRYVRTGRSSAAHVAQAGQNFQPAPFLVEPDPSAPAPKAVPTSTSYLGSVAPAAVAVQDSGHGTFSRPAEPILPGADKTDTPAKHAKNAAVKAAAPASGKQVKAGKSSGNKSGTATNKSDVKVEKDAGSRWSFARPATTISSTNNPANSQNATQGQDQAAIQALAARFAKLEADFKREEARLVALETAAAIAAQPKFTGKDADRLNHLAARLGSLEKSFGDESADLDDAEQKAYALWWLQHGVVYTPGGASLGSKAPALLKAAVPAATATAAVPASSAASASPSPGNSKQEKKQKKQKQKQPAKTAALAAAPTPAPAPAPASAPAPAPSLAPVRDAAADAAKLLELRVAQVAAIMKSFVKLNVSLNR